MKKIILLVIAWSSYVCTHAQTIVAAEFFVDADPGVGNATPITVSPTGANVNFVASVPTTSLSNGFHFVGIRTKDNLGKWGLYENRGFYISSSTTNVGNITAAEFFVDADPGVGNATAITPITAGPNPTFVATIPTTSLSNGFHFVAIRTKDVDGKWGLFENRGFYISSSTTNVGNITAAEFFVDADPGVGNGTPIAVTSGANVNFVATVPTTSLTPGFHFVAIRTKDVDGKWGLFENRGFYISTQTNNVGNLVAAESFVDADPGVGNGTPISVTTGANVNFVASVSTASLAAGFHFVAIRTKDADGKWGLFENRGFYISTQTTNSAGMTAAEYFIDTDPGVGNGTSFTIPGGQSFNQNFVLPIPVGTSQGQHFIAIRTKNDWGLFAFDTITVTGTVPLKLLSFDAYKNQSTVLLKWKTTNEVNTSYFDIERSSNSGLYSKIGSVVAVNTSGNNNYAFEDVQPLKGVNFYRLKQVDIDGKTTYSNIVKVLFDEYGKQVNIYPNPATQLVNIDFGGRQKTVIINVYDAQGRQVIITSMQNQQPLKLNINHLPKGKYIVQLSDGETNNTANFIKQ
ncbi:MAG: T9SS type A sorting domain-containing protein [Chitinophagaceae bacterium]|nr:T9SS type A sorting domain-containing protein [Chitinophagaceae bacterium]